MQLQELVSQSDARVAQNRTGLLPQITGAATYTRLDPVAKVAFPVAPGRTEELQFVPNNNCDVHLTAQYALYDFGANKARITLAERQRGVASTNIALARRDLTYAAVQGYYAILALRESIRVSGQQIADLGAHQHEAVDGGQAPNGGQQLFAGQSGEGGRRRRSLAPGRLRGAFRASPAPRRGSGRGRY